MAIDNIPLIVSENTQEVVLDIDDTSHPYYVGARAYVTQIPEGAIVTVIDKFGTTEAVLLDGNQGNITDISYDPDTKTIKKINGVVTSDLVTLSDVAISNDYGDLDNLPDIDDIIDDHPITNVQDGAITETKFSNTLKERIAKKYNSLAELVADTSLVVGQVCFVEGLCYDIFDAYNVMFDIVDNNNDRANEYVSISLDNGLYAIPKVNNLPSELPRNTASTANAIINTALSYVDRSDFEYGHNTLFATTCEKNANDKYEIDCSSLSQAALMGISYENSRYALGNAAKNLPSEWGFKYPKSSLPTSPLAPNVRKYGYLANELAFYCYTHGYLYEINELGTNVQAGDIIFECADVVSPSYFMQIGHTGVVMQNMGNGSIRIIESGYGNDARLYPILARYVCAIRTYACGKSSSIKWGARIPVEATEESREITALINDIPERITGNASSSNFLQISAYTNEIVREGKLYTIELESDFQSFINSLSSIGAILNLGIGLYNNSGSSIQTTFFPDATYLLNNERLYVTFTPQRDIGVSANVRLGIGTDSASAISCNFPIYSFRIWEGFPIERDSSADISSIGEFSIEQTLTTNKLFIRNKKIFADVTVPSIASGLSETKVGTFGVWNGNYRRYIGSVSCYSPSNITHISIYAQRGEVKLILNTTQALSNIRFAIMLDLNDN